jgi:hypothetical protein
MIMSGKANQFTRIHPVTFLILALPLLFTFVGCDQQVQEQSFDQITPDNFFENEDQFVSALTSAYAPLRDLHGAPMRTQGMVTDEMMAPARGPDWGAGNFRQNMTSHIFNPDNPRINGSWDSYQLGVARTNSFLESVKLSEGVISQEKKDQFSAEARFIRAYFYYRLMDQFGGVPIVVEEGSELDFPTQPVDPANPPARNSRKEVFDFILQELTGCTSQDFSVGNCIQNPESGTVISNLAVKGEVPYGRVTKGAAYALMARLLVNAEIYTGEVTQSNVDTGTRLYEGAAAAADQVINSGRYRLEDYFKNFSADNHTSDEIIFAATFKSEDGLGLAQTHMSTLHPNTPIGTSPWNGFATIAEFYKAFELGAGDDGKVGTQDDIHVDRRGKMFLAGAQYQRPNEGCFGDNCFSDTTSEAITIRGEDTQLNYTLEIPALRLGDVDTETLPEDFPARTTTFLFEAPGIRPMKFEADPGRNGAGWGNDFPLFRLTEMYLIKAEAMNERGNMGEALDALNKIRDERGVDQYTTEEASSELKMHQLIVQERGYEFVYEGLRRPTLIRYEFAYGGSPVGFEGSDKPEAEVYAPTFTGPWLFKSNSDAFRALFPIPNQALSANPNLTQNPGY